MDNRIKQMTDYLPTCMGEGLYRYRGNLKKKRRGSKSCILIKNQEKIGGGGQIT